MTERFDCTFDLILEEWAESEWEALADASEFKASKKHERAMRRIFKRFERNEKKLCRCSGTVITGIKSVRRRITAVILVVIMAVLSGITTVYCLSRSFNLEENYLWTEISFLNTENCPASIEYEYYLPVLPEEFELIHTDMVTYGGAPCLYKLYLNKGTGQIVRFKQCVKPEFGSIRHNTLDSGVTEVEINGHSGLFTPYYEIRATWLMWDNGDYVLELSGNLNKYDMTYLAETAKIL